MLAAAKGKNAAAKAKGAKKAALQGTKEQAKRKIRTSVIFRRCAIASAYLTDLARSSNKS